MNHYERLEVSPTASASVIRAAYKSLMQRHHPDKVAGSAIAQEHAMQLAQAYRVLSNEADRAAYDESVRREQAVLLDTPWNRSAKTVATRNRRHPDVAWRGPAYVWFLVAVIAASGLTVWLLSDRQKAESPSVSGRRTSTQVAAPVLRTQRIHLLTPDLKVQLSPSGTADERVYTLTIPALVVEMRGADRDPFPRLIESQMSEIIRQLARQLRSASLGELRIAGDDYLADFLKQALTEITRSPEFLPNEPGSLDAAATHDIVRVTLPESFILQ